VLARVHEHQPQLCQDDQQHEREQRLAEQHEELARATVLR
jgi:hypothetical protein